MTSALSTVGAEVFVKGYITRNSWVGARSARVLETNLGYGKGRLDAGWSVLVLIEPLKAKDFEFRGTTLRSGGRLGLPAETKEANDRRVEVHSEIWAERGEQGYRELQDRALSLFGPLPSIDPMTKERGPVIMHADLIKGPDRLVKVKPVADPDGNASPKDAYPMGGGGLQWELIRACRFVVAMVVNRDQIAFIPGFSAFIGESAVYEDRARLARHIATVDKPSV